REGQTGDARAECEDHQEDQTLHEATACLPATRRAETACATRSSKSARNLVRKPSMGHAAASPSAQMVLPAMPCAIEASSSTSPAWPSPSATRVQTRASQPVPSRQGVHWPQLSWA